MTPVNLDYRTLDRGGRRCVKDRRYRVQSRNEPERRTGLTRRSGYDRRLKKGELSDRDTSRNENWEN